MTILRMLQVQLGILYICTELIDMCTYMPPVMIDMITFMTFPPSYPFSMISFDPYHMASPYVLKTLNITAPIPNPEAIPLCFEVA